MLREQWRQAGCAGGKSCALQVAAGKHSLVGDAGLLLLLRLLSLLLHQACRRAAFVLWRVNREE
jgi:hypothetical protein